MKKQIYDEKNGLSYTLHGDYYLPDLGINEEESTYGKYGIMLMYGKEASNRKQEIDRQHHTIPNKRTKDKHYGNVHNRLWNHG